MFQSVKKIVLFSSLFFLCLVVTASAQDTSGVVRIENGIPRGMARILDSQLVHSVQKRGLKLAKQNGYKSRNDWSDTLRYWTDEKSLRAVSYINSAYEYTTVVFDQSGKWLQTANYLNPEFYETSRILPAIEDKGYYAPALNSPIGPIIQYRTVHASWYEAEAIVNQSTETKVILVLDGDFRVVSVRK
jgi:hypothetical protein